MTDDRLTDLSAQIGALKVAHDALGRIALMGDGVTQDWAKTALRQMKELLVDRPPLRVVDEHYRGTLADARYDRILGEGRN